MGSTHSQRSPNKLKTNKNFHLILLLLFLHTLPSFARRIYYLDLLNNLIVVPPIGFGSFDDIISQIVNTKQESKARSSYLTGKLDHSFQLQIIYKKYNFFFFFFFFWIVTLWVDLLLIDMLLIEVLKVVPHWNIIDKIYINLDLKFLYKIKKKRKKS